MIKINTTHIGDMPLAVKGTESPAILELPEGDVMETRGEIEYNLQASMAGMDLLVTGKVCLNVSAQCGVCLEPFNTKLQVKDVCHLYEHAAGQEVDVTPDIREDLLLAMPIVFKCSPHCKGICSGCGANLNTEKCTCGKKKKSAKKTAEPAEASPWDALSALKFKK